MEKCKVELSAIKSFNEKKKINIKKNFFSKFA
jgi:hypothetical protein